MIQDPYFNVNRSIERLKKDYDAHKSLIVAFDFDDTIFDFHSKGYTYPQMVKMLLECQELGFTLILFTGNEGEQLTGCAKYCKKLGLKDFYINESPILKTNRKPYYNILLDDRAGLGEAFHILKTVIKEINYDTADSVF